MLKPILSIILNLLNFLVTTIIVIIFLTEKGKPMKERLVVFRYFTTDSNIFCALASLLAAGFEIAALAGGGSAAASVTGSTAGAGSVVLPMAVLVIKFMSTAAVMLTFLTVLFFLGPVSGYRALYARDGFHMHMVGPLIALGTFIFLENGVRMPLLLGLLGALPELAYALVYLQKVVMQGGEENGGWPDFYFLYRNKKWVPSFCVMLLAGVAIGMLLVFCHNLAVR